MRRIDTPSVFQTRMNNVVLSTSLWHVRVTEERACLRPRRNTDTINKANNVVDEYPVERAIGNSTVSRRHPLVT